jgi:HK97 family phage major capsid protein
MASDFGPLIPIEMSREILQSTVAQSAALSLARIQRMTTAQMDIPVLASLPQAKFLAAVGAVKPQTEIRWSSEMIHVEEVACTIAVPRAYIDDSAFPLWGEIRPRLSEAMSKAVDDAIISGLGAPASFPTGGVIAAGNPPIQAVASPGNPDFVGAISLGMARVENSGLDVSGFAARTSVRAQFRNLRATTGEWLIWQPSSANGPANLYGEPLVFTKLGFAAGVPDLIVGDWQMLVIGLREDMRFELSEHGVLTDPVTREVVISAFEQDMVLMRVWMRLGAVIGIPFGNKPDGSQGLGTPFANVRVPTGSFEADEAAEPASAGSPARNSRS